MPIRIPKGLSFVVSHKRAEHGHDADMNAYATSDDHYEISFMVEGQRKTETLTDVYYMNAPCVASSSIHSTHGTSSVNDSAYERILVKITEDKYKEIQQIFGEEKVEILFGQRIHYFNEETTELMMELFLEMEKEYHNRSAYTKVILTSIFTRIIATMLRDGNYHVQCDGMKNTNNAYVNKAIQYTVNHFAQSPSIEKVAQHVSLSTSYFLHLFKEETGMTYGQYLTTIKLEHARNLLIKSNCNMEEIALMSGFDNGNYLATIRYCGVDYKDINPELLREDVSLISQDVFLFPMSIYDNIRVGKADASEAEIMEAARLANCYDFIMELPDQFQTYAGERGSHLSGGQKQRISIARAILKNAPVILLDEPTSALDKESEFLVNEAIDRITKNKTVVVVAHRMTTITNADQIIVMDGGRIVERGTHGCLMKEQGMYRKLYEEYTNGDNYDESDLDEHVDYVDKNEEGGVSCE